MERIKAMTDTKTVGFRFPQPVRAGRISIELDKIDKSYGEIIVYQNFSIRMERGWKVALVGENGAGKSTLMKILAGVQTQDDGGIRVEGNEVWIDSVNKALDLGISLIHQELNLVEELSAAANIFLGREKCTRWGWLKEREMEQAAQLLLSELECDFPANARAGSLRVGDQQLIEIAKALSLNSRIVIMDEPTSALTETEVERLDRVIARLRRGNSKI